MRAGGLAVQTGAEKFQIGGSAYEAAWIEKIGDVYWFFGSMGSCCAGLNSTYAVVAARSEHLRGPYYGRTGRELMANGATVVLDGMNTVAGPGHIALTQDAGGRYWMLYHAWSPENLYSQRQLFLDPVDFYDDGWPAIGTGYPSYPEYTAQMPIMGAPREREQ